MRPVLLLLLLLTLLTFAPAMAPAQAQYGIIAGWSRTDWDVDSYHGSDDFLEPKNGFQVGFYLEGRLAGLLGMRTELLYARKGAKEKIQAIDENGDPLGEATTFFNADYIQIPLLLTLDFTSRPVKAKPQIFLGPYLAGKLSSKLKVEGNPSSPYLFEGEYDLPVEDVDLGLVFGFLVEFKTGGHPLQAQVRFDLGLTDVYSGAKNQALTIMAGYGF